MPRIQLTGGAYAIPGLIAANQRCVNLIPEQIPVAQGEPAAFTHIPTPGVFYSSPPPPFAGRGRGIYVASDNSIYLGIGNQIYFYSYNGGYVFLGFITTSVGQPLRWADNGVTVVVGDGTPNSYQIDMTTHVMTAITDSAFYGFSHVTYIDTYFIYNRPGTPQFYAGPSNAVTPFDPLYIVSKTGGPDRIVGLIALERLLWIFGEQTTEVWYLSGAADFPFQTMPNMLIEHGCIAPWSIAKQAKSVFWLSVDKQGANVVYEGSGGTANRVSTHAIEVQFSNYESVTDAIGWTSQVNGHQLYFLTFPTGDATWVYDNVTKLWHQRTWSDPANLNEHRIRNMSGAYTSYQGIHSPQHIGQDWENGKLLVEQGYSDVNGGPLRRVRTFPHMMNDGKRQQFLQFIVDMQCGQIPVGLDDTITLRFSVDRGLTWSSARTAKLGHVGEVQAAIQSLQFNRLGMGRDCVFEVAWIVNGPTVLNGAFTTTRLCRT